MRIALAFLALASAALAQDKVKLELKMDPGQSLTIETTNKSAGRIKVQQGKDAQERDILNNEEAEWTDTVKEVKNGAPIKVEREYRKFKFEKKEFADEARRNGSRTLEGQKITLSLDGGARTKFDAPPAVSADDLRDLNLRDEALRKSMPADAVAPGFSWNADPKEVVADANDQEVGVTYSEGSLKFTFEKIEDRGGDKCAVIKAVGDATGTTSDKLTLKLKMETTMYLSLARKDVIESTTTGSYELTGGGEAEGFVLTGTGKFDATMKAKPAK